MRDETAVFIPTLRSLILAVLAGPLPAIVLVLALVLGFRIGPVMKQAVNLGLGRQVLLLLVLICGLLLTMTIVFSLTLRPWLAVHVRASGIGGRGSWGQLVFFSWDRVEDARRIAVPFSPLVRIRGGGRSLYVPVCLRHADAFAALVARVVPDDQSALRTLLLNGSSAAEP